MASNSSTHSQPLKGLLVVSLEQAVAAPTCSVKLADAGARVIKIERSTGDIARHYDEVVKGTSANFAWLNRGKESVVLDVKDEKDMEIIHAILAKADVFIQNFAPGASKRLGLDADSLMQRYPQLIVVDIFGYDQGSEFRDMRAYDMLVQAESGVCSVTGTADNPAKVGVSIADIGTGMAAHAMVLEALISRSITGKGCHLPVSMFDVMADWMTVPLLYQVYAGQDVGRHGLEHAMIYPYAKFSCSDGDLMIAIQNKAEWQRLCEIVFERPDLIAHPDYDTNPKRSSNRRQLDLEIAPIFAAMSRDQAIDRLKIAKIAWSRVTPVEELANHPAINQIRSILPDGQEFSLPIPAGRTQLAQARIPSLGEHTDKIRSEYGEGVK